MFINHSMKSWRIATTTTFMIATSSLGGSWCSMSFVVPNGRIGYINNRYYNRYSRQSCPSSLGKRHSISIMNEQLRFIGNLNRYQQQQRKHTRVSQSRSLHLTSSSYFSNKSNDNIESSSSSTMKHQLYLQQIQELELERQTLLGSDNMIHERNSNNNTNSITNISLSSSQGTLPTIDSLHNNNNNNDTSNTQSDFISYINRKEDYGTNKPPVVVMSDRDELNEDSSVISSNNDNNNNIDDDHHHDDNTIHSERELVYGFTIEEKNAWMNSNNSFNNNNNNEETKRKHESLLRDIALARQQQDQQQQKMKQDYDHYTSLQTTIDTSTTDAIAATNSRISTTSQSSSVPSFSHLTSDEKHIHMVNVGSKNITHRTATAQSMVIFPPEVLHAFSNQTNITQQEQEQQQHADEWIGPKGPIFATAITAGIMGVKQTSTLIPLCHPLPIEHIQINIIWYNTNTIQITCTCSVTHKTGVEMEALMGCSITALTIYDMVKAISHNVQITNTQLLYKDGGKRLFDQRTKE